MTLATDTLFRLISVAINTKYVDNPPTEEEFLCEAGTLRSSLSSVYPVDDAEYAELLNKLRASLVIRMDVGVYINDRSTGHQSWLPARRADLEFFFWNRYRRYLEENKRWNTRVTATLNRVSDDILDLLGDPRSKAPFQIRGLVLGDVQSGKTANYTALTNKAADTGYRIIIILAGMMENLRKQTQSRLDEECAGRRSEYYLDPKVVDTVIKNQPVGVGKYGQQHKIASFTSVTKDFDINVLKSNSLSVSSIQDPVLIVVKKNKRILQNLTKWLVENNADPSTGIIDLPMMLIDDEADNASVNTRDSEDSPAAINSCIRKLLHAFRQASYVGITATPFANIFIDPETDDEMFGNDLFPADFIYALEPPTNYIGADRIFGDDAEYFSMIQPLYHTEMDAFFPYTHKRDLEVDALPPSMQEAIAYFLLINAIRDKRGDETTHRSMMIHVSRFTDVQNRLRAAVSEWLDIVKTDVLSYSKVEIEKAMQFDSIRLLSDVWNKHGLSRLSGMSWETCLHDYLHKAIAPIDVRAVNQRTGATSLDYFSHKEDGLRVIAVGGNSMSRGITLEGLCVTYFYRRSQMYDTLLQMGRWFGYRPNYEDLCRIWLSEDAVDWYGYITRAANELKLEIAKMKNANQTPREFGLKVRQDPDYALLATARNKMRTATTMTRPVTVSGRLLETPRLKKAKNILESNERVFRAFVKKLPEIGQRVKMPRCEYFWKGVPKLEVSQLLLDFETHLWHLAFNGRGLSEYIEKSMDDTPWDVALMISGDGDPLPGGLACGDTLLSIDHTESRKVKVEDDSILINDTKVRVGSGGCAAIGLTPEQIDKIKKAYAEERRAEGKPVGNVPDGRYLIADRAPILMLHIINVKTVRPEEAKLECPDFLYALGVGFPDNGDSTKSATYVVNLVELRNWIDFNEDYDE